MGQSRNSPGKSILRLLFDSWTWVMAWRESRTHRFRLLLYMSTIAMGIAALVAVSSFSESLEKGMLLESKSLMGADLIISSRQPFDEETNALFEEIGGVQSSVTEFASMAYIPESDNVRMARIIGIKGGYPFYGNLKTVPLSASEIIRLENGHALVDLTMMNQYEINVGDRLKIGDATFSVAGNLEKMPGQSSMGSMFAPSIVISGEDIRKTGLIRKGSVAFYMMAFKFGEKTDLNAMMERIKPALNARRLTGRTINQFEERLVRQLGNVNGFLRLVAFIALILGSIGVSSAVHVYIRRKVDTVAILRCLGADIRRTFAVYLAQAGMIGLIGTSLGVVGGLLLQFAMPFVISDFLSLEIGLTFTWLPIVHGFIMGMGMTILFSLLPLLVLRKIPPLRAIRSSVDIPAKELRRDPLRWIIYSLIILSVTCFAVFQSGKWWHGIVFSVSVFVAFSILYGLAKLLMLMIRKFFPKSFGYVWRQALANLYRPNNQTVILVLALGLGTFLFCTLFIVQHSLLAQVTEASGENRPNLIFYDIQPDQVDSVVQLVRNRELPVLENVPMVTMRLKSIKGQSVEDVRNDKDKRIPRWILLREYRSTFRNKMNETEAIIDGEWHGSLKKIPDPVPVSLEKDLSQRMEVGIGDRLEIDIQGFSMEVQVGSIREVDWRQFRTNFFMVFPDGVIDDAPRINVVATRIADEKESAEFQKVMVKQFPGVSAIDLQMVFRTIDSVIDRISHVIRFMSLFSIFTGIMVLLAALSTTRFQRIQESVLIRIIGGSRLQIRKIMLLEYIILGTLGSGTGALLSLSGSFTIIRLVFDSPFVMPVFPIVVIMFSVILITTFLGMLNSRGILKQPPLSVIRSENM